MSSFSKINAFAFAGIMLVSLSACGGNLGSSSSSVWDDYDYRHPVPYDSPVPAGDGTVFIYRDNDADYVQPKGWGTCSPNDPVCE